MADYVWIFCCHHVVSIVEACIQSQIILMDTLKQLLSFVLPEKVKCDQGAFETEFPNDAAATDEDYSPVHTSMKRKVPSVEHVMGPVLGLTGDHEIIKGFKFDVAFPLSEYFHILQSWEIPNSGIKEEGQNMMQMMMGRGTPKPTYTFMSQVVQGITSPNEPPGLMLMGKVDSQGRVDSILMKRLAAGLNLKLSAQFMNSKTEDGALGADLEFEDADSTGMARLAHHPMQGLTGSINYMQRVHQNLMLGFDFTHLFAHKKQMFSYSAKAFLGNHALYASTIQGGAAYHIGYVIPIRKGTTFCSHWSWDPEKGSNTSVGFRQRYDALEIHANMNSKFKLATVFNFRSNFYGLKLSAEVDYPKDHYSFGYGISIGQQQ